MKLGAFKDALRKAPEVKPKEWKKPLPDESMNCPNCHGNGIDDGSAIMECAACHGSGLLLSGAPKLKKKRKTVAEDVSAALKSVERRAHPMVGVDFGKDEGETSFLLLPKGTRAEMLGPIKGREATMVIIDDPLARGPFEGSPDDAVDSLGGILGALKKSRGKSPTDFLEDIFDVISTSDREKSCPMCGVDEPLNANDHANDCPLVTMKKCMECEADMGLVFARRNIWKRRCKACIREKFEAGRK